jgi:exopolyphosphatase/guanosine-5'-triphosphate,3'-diphosphate pyrophosphatase
MRDASNGQAFIERVRRKLGVRIDLIDGRAEARYGFLGAVHGLPVETGKLFDMGGGSMQISSFASRRLARSVSLPLGALRLSNRFLESDPPAKDEIRRLRKHVCGELQEAGIGRLRGGESLVGTGGTVRNLAKVDARARDFPVERIHGYVLRRDAVSEIVEQLAETRLKKRDNIPGLSDDRADSIVGGAVGIETLMEELRAESLVVSGQGVREGLAASLLGAHPPRIESVRRTAVRSLAMRFDTWDARSAERRESLAASLFRCLERRGSDEHLEALKLAAFLLDIGRSLDFFDRHEHTARILMAAEMNAFSQRQVALAAAIARRAGDERWDPAVWSPLVDGDEEPAIERAAVLLILGDDIEERCPGSGPIGVRCRKSGRAVHVRVRTLVGWRSRALGPRFEAAFDRELIVER